VKPTARQRRPSALTKDSEDYRDKRDRNNASVRKSRDKARQKQEETEGRVDVSSRSFLSSSGQLNNEGG